MEWEGVQRIVFSRNCPSSGHCVKLAGSEGAFSLVLSYPEWRRTNFVMARYTFPPVTSARLKSMWNSNYSSPYQQFRLIPDVTIEFQVTQLLLSSYWECFCWSDLPLFKASFPLQGSWTVFCFDASTFFLGIVSIEVSIEMWSRQVIKWQRQESQGFAKHFSLQSVVEMLGNILSLIPGEVMEPLLLSWCWDGERVGRVKQRELLAENQASLTGKTDQDSLIGEKKPHVQAKQSNFPFLMDGQGLAIPGNLVGCGDWGRRVLGSLNVPCSLLPSAVLVSQPKSLCPPSPAGMGWRL